MKISITQRGDFSKTMRFLAKEKTALRKMNFDKYGREGVALLASATPVRTGLTAASWRYEVKKTSTEVTITFLNDNVQNGVPIAIILQYGHGTGTGGWVQGRDYINPALRSVFDKLADSAWKEVTKL